jgi:CoA:oxalate CoA-transferase
VIIPAANDALWAKLCNILGITQYIDDPRFKTNRDRVANVEVLYDLLGEVTKTRTTAEWMEILESGGVPVGPINTIDKVVEDPQVLAREMIVEISHPVAGPMKIAGNPIKLSDTPGKVSEPAPLLGQHTEWVLRDVLGWNDEKIAAFKSE